MPEPEQFDIPFTDLPPIPKIVPFPKPPPDSSEAAEIYALYPFKVARPYALNCIRNALRKFTSDFLKERTARFAELRRDCLNAIPRVPNPSTWFNQERFNDDETTWLPYQDEQPTPAKLAEMQRGKLPAMPKDQAPTGWEEFLAFHNGGEFACYKGTYRHAESYMKTDFAKWLKTRKAQ